MKSHAKTHDRIKWQCALCPKMFSRYNLDDWGSCSTRSSTLDILEDLDDTSPMGRMYEVDIEYPERMLVMQNIESITTYRFYLIMECHQIQRRERPNFSVCLKNIIIITCGVSSNIHFDFHSGLDDQFLGVHVTSNYVQQNHNESRIMIYNRI
ncbi:Hypothetical protein CINCED_3A012402 [Cinara cedri]|uniref:Uncharacterized protein n=1 Tax=Cinara cedri TaxID=506608 RepID=A0A5E4NLC8_9HEMI|nr:Hypothetical protein CINCED_3A012402 [Cinara cedri]